MEHFLPEILFEDLSWPEIIGYLALLYVLIWLPTRYLLSWLLNQCQGASRRILKPGPADYAIITGATDGIGLEYAKQLAARGYNLFLLSRTEEKLRRVATEIAFKYPKVKRIEILAVDFSKTNIYQTIRHKLESLPGRVHVLVNNVGYAYDIPEYFANYPEEYNLSVINTNIVSVTEMSYMVLRLMNKNPANLSCASTAKGVIINVSSALGLTEYPLFSTYGSSKAYINFLGRILATECAKDGIIVQTVTPNQVNTKMARHLYEAALTVPVDDCVRYSLATLGSERQTNGHPKHKLLAFLSHLLGLIIGPRLFMQFKYCVSKILRKRCDARGWKPQEKETSITI